MQISMFKKGTVLVIIVLLFGASYVSGLSCKEEVNSNSKTSDYKVGIKWNAGGVSSNEIATWFSGCILRLWDNNFLYKIDNTNWTEIEVYGDTSINYNHSSGIYFSGDSHTDASCRIVHSDYIPFDDYYSIEMKPQLVSGWGGIGTIFNFQDIDNFNEIYLTWNNDCYITYLQHIDGEIYGYWRIETSFSAGTYDLKLEVNNTDGTCKIYLNEELMGIVDIRLPPDTVYVDDDFDENTSGWGYDHFDSIQDGIDYVNKNGTVHVYNGTYYENVDINKDGINLIGENKNMTIIDATNEIGSVVKIENHNHINISGFSITNAQLGDISLEGNGIILFAHSHGPTGVTVNYNTISDCKIYNNAVAGIIFCSHDELGQKSNNNSIINCEIYSNGYNGIRLTADENCIVKNTQILNSRIFNNGIDDNPPASYRTGISFHTKGEVSNTLISECLFYNNSVNGIFFGKHPEHGAMANNNFIYHCNLVNDTNNAYDECTNFWNSSFGKGNYWTDYTGTDADGNGIGDTPYPIPGGDNQDSYPLMHPFGPPYATFTYDNETSIFNASLSGDYNGEIVEWSWSFGDGTTGDGEVVYHKYCEVGTYFVVLKVFDNDGFDDIFYKNVDVLLANILPEVEIYGPNQGKPGVEYDYVFNIIDLDGDELYLWVDWDDNTTTKIGPLTSGQNITIGHIWMEKGVYLIKAMVEDNCGESEWVEFEIEIPRNKMPVNSLFLRLLECFMDVFPMIKYLFNLMI